MKQLTEANRRAKADARLIALDWGTSSLRAMLLGADAALLDARVAPLGIMQIGEGGFEAAYRSMVADWLAEAKLPAIAAGMVGSAQGWLEAPYCQETAGARELAGRLAKVALSDGGALHLVPGVSLTEPRAEVMRGEETQVVGALTLFPHMRREAVFVLPGTHSKWIRIEDGCIRECQTFMTGELFAVLRQHSILGRFAGAGEPEATATEEEDSAFDTGVEVARTSAGGISPLLFSARAKVLLGQLPKAASLAYLSGVLIGDELRNALAHPIRAVVMIGDARLCARYRRAARQFGVSDMPEVENATRVGLWAIAREAGLVK